MSITSLTFTFVNTYAATSAKPVAAIDTTKVSPAPAPQEDDEACDGQRPGGGENRLVLAIMSALREIGLVSAAASAPAPAQTSGSTAAATSTPPKATTPAAATAASATSPTTATPAAANASAPASGSQAAGSAQATSAAPATNASISADANATATPASGAAATVESAVHQFAHELFSAMRQIGRGDSSDGDSRRVEGEGHHRHHGHHHRHGHGYGDMSQRLEALAQTVGGSTHAVLPGDAPTSAPGSSSVSVTLTVQDRTSDTTPQAATTTIAPTPSSTVGASSQAATTTATQPATTPAPAAIASKNALLDAFSKLFNAIKPQSPAATEPDMQGKLRTFLYTLAAAMQQPGALSIAPTPQIGSLVNVTA